MIFDGNFSGVKAERRANIDVRRMKPDTEAPVQKPAQEDGESSFYWSPDKEIMLGSRFSNVHIYMTEHK